MSKQSLTPGRLRMLSALIENMEGFFCNDNDNRDDSMVFALDNGFDIHAVNCFVGTGATDRRFDRIYNRLVLSVGTIKWNELNRSEAKELCDFARIQICTACNHHAFTDPSDEGLSNCSSCLKPLPVVSVA